MKRSPELKFNTPKEWVDAVLNDFDSFLQDHADCERKASAMAMSLVYKCPDKVKIIPLLIETALEEMEHFKQVYDVMHLRGIRLKHETEKDPYIEALMKLLRTPSRQRLLDRFLLASIIECRGTERFRMVEEALEDSPLKKFYKMLWASEAKHGNIFVEMALEYYPEEEVFKRMDELVTAEAEICSRLPVRPALH
jgi:tRNA-(ms[2]io[6]A)-hydroxylase